MLTSIVSLVIAAIIFTLWVISFKYMKGEDDLFSPKHPNGSNAKAYFYGDIPDRELMADYEIHTDEFGVKRWIRRTGR